MRTARCDRLFEGKKVRWTMLVAAVLWAASCGQKGPLYLPENKAIEVPVVMASPSLEVRYVQT